MISQKTFDAFEGELSLFLGWTDLVPRDFALGKFALKWEQAGAHANEKKLRRYSQLARDNYQKVFSSLKRDDRLAPWESIESAETGTDKDVHEKDVCFINLGKELRDAKFMIKMRADDTDPQRYGASDINRFFAPFGVTYYFFQDFSSAEKRSEKRHWLELVQLNPSLTQSDLQRVPPSVAITYKLVATHWPENDSRQGPATFEEIAERSTGVKKLAILRADVDNLGTIFRIGLGQNATVSRVAALSTALSDFFEGYVNHLARTEEYKDKIGIIYAGGDDLFLVGAWNAVFDFAIQLRDDFQEYSGNNPELSFSGGIVVIDHHLPIRFAAELAHDAEETAKKYERGRNLERRKNALTMFDQPIGFEEMDRFVDFGKNIQDLLEPTDESKKGLPQGFLRRLFEIWEVYLKERESVQLRQMASKTPIPFEKLAQEARWQRWRWLLIYGLRDFAKKANDRKEEIENIQKAMLDPENPIEDRLGVPLRWTELLLRKEEK